MKLKTIFLSFLPLCVALLFAGCEKEELSPLADKILTVLEINSEGCKKKLKSTETERYIELKAERENQLRLKFINASLNCCPGETTSNVYIENEVLKVIFIEEAPAECDCICDFDLECLIDSMESRQYDLEVYANGEKPKAKITFTYSSGLDSKINVSND